MEKFKRALAWILLAVLTTIEVTLKFLFETLPNILTAVFCTRWVRFALWFVYFKSQNDYFGWNAKPMSDAELITDGIWVLLLMFALWPESKKSTTIVNMVQNSEIQANDKLGK